MHQSQTSIPAQLPQDEAGLMELLSRLSQSPSVPLFIDDGGKTITKTYPIHEGLWFQIGKVVQALVDKFEYTLIDNTSK